MNFLFLGFSEKYKSSPIDSLKSSIDIDLKIPIDIYGSFVGPKTVIILPIFFLSLLKTEAPEGGDCEDLAINLPELDK
ncbi:hypothetical protein MARBORIA2_10990 [Methanobrevibacter arboriphilus]|nr:hypothetical protein MARBORIA2_10990 [Methanobrevibacter arboriphilus]